LTRRLLSSLSPTEKTRRVFCCAAGVMTPGIRLSPDGRGRHHLALVVVATTLRAYRHEGQYRQAEDTENDTNAFHDLS
jgi:hypothetical protein